jgi:uncharacterized protein (UPF0276 family)
MPVVNCGFISIYVDDGTGDEEVRIQFFKNCNKYYVEIREETAQVRDAFDIDETERVVSKYMPKTYAKLWARHVANHADEAALYEYLPADYDTMSADAQADALREARDFLYCVCLEKYARQHELHKIVVVP